MRRIAITTTIFVAALASPGAAQSLFSTRGLGMPNPSLGSRARALGGIGVGLLGLDLSLVNPAEVAGIGLRGISASLQPSTGSADVAGVTDDASGARFPMVRAVYPIGRTVWSVGFGSYLDQSWGVSLTGQEAIGSDTIGVTDVIQARGAIARMSLGVAYQVSPSLSIGLSGGVNSGSLDRRVSRTFNDSTSGLRDFDTRLRWDYGGLFGTAGVRLDLASVARVGGSVTLSRKLDIEGIDEIAQDEAVEIPMRFNVGASASLSSTLLLAGGFEHTGGVDGHIFSAIDATALQRSTWRYGAGIEYTGLRKGSKAFPIRLGSSWAQLPFYDEGEEPASERAFAFGLGLRLAEGITGPLAVGDIAVERGERTGLESSALPSGLKETFWRLTFSLSLFGN